MNKKLAIIFSVVLVIAMVLSFFAFESCNDDKKTEEKTESMESTPSESVDADANDTIEVDEIVNIALFGVDGYEKDCFTGLTDCVMILSFNKKTDTVKMFSVMWYTFLPIMDENYELQAYGKMNSAYAMGGEDVTKSAQIAINTLNNAYNLNIADYIVVNSYGIVDIINNIGGITATITEDEITWKGQESPNLNNIMEQICNERGLDAKEYYITEPGEQTLNGVQAAAYACIGHCRSTWGTNSDYGRTDRQRYITQAIFEEIAKMNSSQQLSFIDKFVPNIRSSVSPNEMFKLMTDVLVKESRFEEYRLPPEGYISEVQMTPNFDESENKKYGSVIYYDLEYAAEMINSIIYKNLTVEEFIAENPIRKNDWYSEISKNN